MDYEGKAATRQVKDAGENDIEWKKSTRLLDAKGPCDSVGKNHSN